MLSNKQSGQSLIEILVVLAVAAVMIIALIMVILSSLKSAQFAQNQAKATKYAQDAVDKIKAIRDKDDIGKIVCSLSSDMASTYKFSELYTTVNLCGISTPSYTATFNISYDSLNIVSTNTVQNIGSGFTRMITIGSFAPIAPAPTPSPTDFLLTVKVSWTDSSGPHESNVQTYITSL